MKQYIDKSALVAEIERLREDEYPCDTFEESIGYYNALDEIATFLDTLEVREVEGPVSEEFEEAANAYIGYAPEIDECSSVFGKRQAFKAGAKWQKEQLMKDAVYGLVCGHDESSPAWIDLNLLNKPNVKVGTEVKLIIIKDE